MEDNALILSIETSGTTCGINISENGSTIASSALFVKNIHDRVLGDIIKKQMEYLQLTFDDFDAVAVSAGPGSFTGLRIGCSMAKGICYANVPKLIAVSTLSALAFHAKEYALTETKKICAVINSHKNQIYYQLFDTNAHAETEIIQAEAEEFPYNNNPEILLCGTGASLFSQNNDSLNRLHPEKIALLGFEMYQKGEFTDSADFVPIYVQDFEPKTKKKKLNF